MNACTTCLAGAIALGILVGIAIVVAGFLAAKPGTVGGVPEPAGRCG